MKRLYAGFIMFFSFTLSVYTQNVADTLKIYTSAQCEMCKKTIEKTMAYEKGVKGSDLDLDTKILTVIYNKRRTDPENIKKAISNAGYDAGDVHANERVYSKLPSCCKKPDDPDFIDM